MCGLSNWQDGSAINKNGGDCEWSRFREEIKGSVLDARVPVSYPRGDLK